MLEPPVQTWTVQQFTTTETRYVRNLSVEIHPLLYVVTPSWEDFWQWRHHTEHSPAWQARLNHWWPVAVTEPEQLNPDLIGFVLFLKGWQDGWAERGHATAFSPVWAWAHHIAEDYEIYGRALH